MSDMPMQAAIAVALGAGSALACPFTAAGQAPTTPTMIATQQPGHPMQAHPYLGMRVTGDGRIRQALLPNGRYDEARGTRQSADQGRYEITGTPIEYWHDTGLTADGRFVTQDELHHGGMVFSRQPPAQGVYPKDCSPGLIAVTDVRPSSLHPLCVVRTADRNAPHPVAQCRINPRLPAPAP